MFERFSDRARRVVQLAAGEAKTLNHDYIGAEHILLGLIREDEGVAAKALESQGISLEAVRRQIEEIIGQGQPAPSGRIPFTPRAKNVFELSAREANGLGHNYISTEHILLGLIRQGNSDQLRGGDGAAGHVLLMLGADLNRLRQQVIQILSGHGGVVAAAEERDLEDDNNEVAEQGLVLRAPLADKDQIEEILALLRDIIERLERIERQSTDDDAP